MKIGGQAVIEGVMIRSPHRVAVAVRTPADGIRVKDDPYVSFAKRYRVLGIPVLRGAVALVETLVIGMKTLGYSADLAAEAGTAEGKTPFRRFLDGLWTALTMVFAFGLGLGLFFYLPLVITGRLGIDNRILFNLVDGVIRIVFFLAYMYLITRWKEMQRVFAYHGAEHMSIFAFESGEDLTVENARRHTVRHPRCGTSFLLIVMIVSIAVFTFFPTPRTLQDRLLRFLLVPVIGGISFELTRLSDRADGGWARMLIAPGLWLQRLTTREPDDDQLEVALAAVRAAVREQEGD